MQSFKKKPKQAGQDAFKGKELSNAIRDDKMKKYSEINAFPSWVVNGPVLVLVVLLLTIGLCITRASAESKTFILNDDLFSASFVNANDGWVCGDWGSILHTQDGGDNWKEQTSGTEATLSSIFFLDSLTGWAVGNVGTILHTTDGGRNWVIQKSPVTFFHRDVFFVSPSTGWIVSEMTHILYTEDGGTTWHVQFQDEIYNLTAISFSDRQHGWVVGEYGFTYRTKNGGKSWEQQGGYFRVNDETGDIETGVTLFDVTALDNDTGFAVGSDGVVIRTKDAGHTWTRVASDVPAVLFFGVASDGKESIVVGGKGLYLFSTDLGETWKRIRMSPSMEYRWLYGFDSLGSDRYIAVGEEGAIYLGKIPQTWMRVNYMSVP